MKVAVVMYYIYLMFLIAGTSYLVFYKEISAWWWFVTLALTTIAPTSKED